MSNPQRLDQINQIGYYDYGYQYENKEKPITKKFLTPDGYVTTNTLFAEQQKDSEQDRYMCREKKYELVVPNGLDTVPTWMRNKANVSAEFGRIQNEIYSKFTYDGDLDDLFRDRQAQDLAEQMEEMGMSEEDYVRLLNLSNRLKMDSEINNQGDEDQGLNKREGEEGSSGLEEKQEEKEDTPPRFSSSGKSGTRLSDTRPQTPNSTTARTTRSQKKSAEKFKELGQFGSIKKQQKRNPRGYI